MTPLLAQPTEDAARLDADLALLRALRDRAALGPAASPDADALAARAVRAADPDGSSAGLMHSLWGRLDAASRPALAVHGAEAALFAADRFGLNLRLVETADAALAAVTGRALALIEIGSRPWWGRLLARPDLKVVAAFPDAAGARPRALMIAAAAPGPTGDDRTFWVTDSRRPDADVVDDLGLRGLAAEPLAAAGGLKLFLLAGYVQPQDGRLQGAPGDLCGVIGAAPVFRDLP